MRLAVLAALAALLLAPAADAATNRGGAWSFPSAPGLHPPSVRIARHRDGTAPGHLFVAPIPGPQGHGRFGGQIGPLILDDAGQPVWSHPLPHRLWALDFRAQTYRGQPVLTWWQGHIKAQGWGHGTDVVVDSSYRTVARLHRAGGWRPDIHEFAITRRNTALITAYKPHRTSFARYGGPKKRGVLLESIVQEVNLRTGRVLFQWNPLGQVSLRESHTRPAKGLPWDAYHLNAVDMDENGDLLVSARNTWTVYKVSRRTGRIAWRLGGRRSSFRLGRGARFAYQHDARFHGGGTISIFDNEGSPRVGRASRAIVLRVDGRHRVARLVSQYRHPSRGVAGSQGNVQLLANGNALAGWGALPGFSEFDPRGRVLLDARFHGPGESYRTYRLPWTGHPTTLPSIATRPAGAGRTTVYASWNGATEVARWLVRAGSDPNRLGTIASAARNGFETAIAVNGTGPWFAVRAVDSEGRTLETSRAIKP